MAREMVVNCDVCGKSGAEEYNVGKTGEPPWLVDLCSEDANPILEVASRGRQVQQTSPGRAGRVRFDRYVRGVPGTLAPVDGSR